MGLLPCFEGLKRGLMIERFLREVLAVVPGVAMERGFRVEVALEVMSAEELLWPWAVSSRSSWGKVRSGRAACKIDGSCGGNRPIAESLSATPLSGPTGTRTAESSRARWKSFPSKSGAARFFPLLGENGRSPIVSQSTTMLALSHVLE